jgi:hypothetical protein
VDFCFHETSKPWPTETEMHSFIPETPIDVETHHGLGTVVYITVYGQFNNDVWTVANKKTGRIRHYSTRHLKLAPNFTFDINPNEQPEDL